MSQPIKNDVPRNYKIEPGYFNRHDNPVVSTHLRFHDNGQTSEHMRWHHRHLPPIITDDLFAPTPEPSPAAPIDLGAPLLPILERVPRRNDSWSSFTSHDSPERPPPNDEIITTRRLSVGPVNAVARALQRGLQKVRQWFRSR